MPHNPTQENLPIVETPICPECGYHGVAQLPQTWHECTEWRCSQCGHQWNDGTGLLLEAITIEQRQLSVAAKQKARKLARDLNDDAASQLLEELAAISGLLLGEWRSAWISTCNAAYQAIHHAATEDQPHAFNHFLELFINALFKMQRQVIEYLRPMPLKYGIHSEIKHWLSEAFEVIWSPMRPGYRGWIIGALEESAPPLDWTPPQWLGEIGDACARIEMQLITDHRSGRTKLLNEVFLAISAQIAAAFQEEARAASIGTATQGIPALANASQPPSHSRAIPDARVSGTRQAPATDVADSKVVEGPVPLSQVNESLPPLSAEDEHAQLAAQIEHVKAAQGYDWRSKVRALRVAQVLKELRMIREAELQLDPDVLSDFDTVVQRFKGRNFYLFAAVRDSETLKAQILNVKKRGTRIGLAQAIVVRGERKKTVTLATVQTDWKRYKPEEYRDR